jgi:hypothetical protein
MSRAAVPGGMPSGRVGLAGLAVLLAMTLAACGGGGGGGGAGGNAKLHVLVINHTDKEANVTYSGGEPLPTGDKPPVASCRAAVIDYALTDPFTLSVNDTVAIDSAQLQGGIPNNGQNDIFTQVDLNKDGSLSNPQGLRVGSSIVKPAQLGICL